MVLAADVHDDAGGERFVLAGAVTGDVECVGNLGVGVVVEEPVKRFDGVGAGLAGLPGCGWYGDDDALGLAAAEPDVQVDAVGLVQGDVVDEEADHAFAVALVGVWVGPEGGEIYCQGPDSVLQFVGEGGCGGGAGAFVVLVRGLQGAERVVPVGFEAVGDEPIIGVDGQVAAPCQVRAVAGAFDVPAAQRVGLGGAGVQFGLHGQGDLERVWGEGVEQQAGDGGVDGAAGDGLAALC